MNLRFLRDCSIMPLTLYSQTWNTARDYFGYPSSFRILTIRNISPLAAISNLSIPNIVGGQAHVGVFCSDRGLYCSLRPSAINIFQVSHVQVGIASDAWAVARGRRLGSMGGSTTTRGSMGATMGTKRGSAQTPAPRGRSANVGTIGRRQVKKDAS